MTDSFLMRLCTVRYNRKPFEQIKFQILTCCVKQQRHQDFFEVQRIAATKRHTKYKRPRHKINHVDTRQYLYKNTSAQPGRLGIVTCGNVSDHALMGRPAARLETIALVIYFYVLVCIVGKRRRVFLYVCYFLIYMIRRPCPLDISLTINRTLFTI